MKTEFCPICQEGDIGSDKCRVCDECKPILMPDYGEDDYSFDHPSIADASGFIFA